MKLVQVIRPERIQVVGSRIRTDGLDNATPIDIISTEIATEQGLNTLGELLRTSTIASGSDQLDFCLFCWLCYRWWRWC